MIESGVLDLAVGSASADIAGADFGPIADCLADCRVVLLGEQSHGDGATQLVKTQVLTELVRRGLLDAIAWEANTYDVWRMSEAVRSGMPPAEAMRIGLYGVWHNREVLRLLELVRAAWAAGQRLDMIGVDSQPSSILGGGKSLADDLETWCEAFLPGVVDADAKEAVEAFVARVVGLQSPGDDVDLGRVASALATVAGVCESVEPRIVDEVLGADTGWVCRASLRNLGVESTRQHLMADMHQLPAGARGGREMEVDAFNMRDWAMAQNLLDWIATHPARRVAVWSASQHIARALSAEAGWVFRGLNTLGDHMHAAVGEQCYGLGFLSHGGSTRRPPRRDLVPLPPRRRDSIEELLHKGGRGLAFADLRFAADRGLFGEKARSCCIGHEGIGRVRLSAMFDGVVYIDEMFPTSAI